MQVGSDDAEKLVPQLQKHPGQLSTQDLTNLPKYHAIARILQDGMPQQPFSIETLPPAAVASDRSEIVRRVSNMRYAKPKSEVLRQSAENPLNPVHRPSRFIGLHNCSQLQVSATTSLTSHG